jgi:hypothetical protein
LNLLTNKKTIQIQGGISMQLKKGFKTVLAVVLSAALTVAPAMTSFAEDTDPSTTAGTGNVLDYQVKTEVVPTALKVAINPNRYPVNIRYNKVASGASYDASKKYYKIDENGKYVIETVTAENMATKVAAGLYLAETSNDQLVTFNYGLVNKSTVDRDILIKFDVTADSAVEFVGTAAEATNTAAADDGGAQQGEYKIFMQLVPAKVGTTPTANTYAKADTYTDADTEYYNWDSSNNKYLGPVKYATEADFKAVVDQSYVATTTIGTEIKATELADIGMQASTAPITFAAGTETTHADVAYKLGKATHNLKATEFIDFSTSDLTDMFEMTAIGGIGGFTITGVMNTNTVWSDLETKTITITPTYKFTDSTGLETSVDTGLNQIEAEARTPAVTVLTGTYDATNTRYQITLPDGVTISNVSEVTNVTANGNAITTIATNGNGAVVRINRSDVSAALGDAWASTTDIEFIFKIGSATYKATIARNG